ncbi:MAG TPA: proline iminopeptidase-family hydrolase [Candidatus Sulfotelmatobacter sp.]|nr:proline iminopeptidase-family hydrolase [Candidatus Sulfotelmatobacter sp.]
MRNHLILLTVFLLPGCGLAQTPKLSDVYTAQSGFVQSHGALIYYEAVGKGAPLLIVHGGPGASHDYFLPYLLPLMRSNRLIFIDERGSGKSSKLEDPKGYTVANMVDDIEAVRLGLGLGRIALMGHSFGGVLVQAYALRYQKNLSHLILASTFASTREMNQVLARIKTEMDPKDRERVSALEAAGLFGKGEVWEHGRYPEEYAKLAWGKGYFPYVYRNRPDPNYDPLSANTGTAWDVYREMWGSDGEFVIDGNLKEVEYVDRLSEIKVPTLIIVGDHDECDLQLSKEMHEKIAGSQLVVLPNSGHMTFVDRTEPFLETVREFAAHRK